MSRIGRRFLLFFGILMGVALILVGLWELGRLAIPSLFGPLPAWIPEDVPAGMATSFLADWLSWIPALALSAVILTFSFGLTPEKLPEGASALVRFSILAIVATVVFSMIELAGQPWVDARLADLAFREVQTRQLEDAYLTLKEKGSDRQTSSDLEARLNLLRRLGTLRPLQSQSGIRERLDYDFELQILKAHMELDDFFKLRALPGVEARADDSQASVGELLDRATQALARGTDDEEFQANLLAFQAYRRLMNASDQGLSVDPRLWDRARALVDESWGRVYEKTLASDERKKASYFFRKGKSLGDFQFQNYLEAYYGFQELHHENPRDTEVTQHWELSRERVARQVLFQQEMEVLFAVPGSDNLIFLNRDSPLEVVRIGKLINTSQGVFLKDFEFLRTDHGRVLLHWKAPYGRWTEAGIDFRVWDQERPEPRFPTVLVETPHHEFNPEAEVSPPLFQPRVTVRDLEFVNSRTPQPQTLETTELLLHGKSIEALGYNSRLFQTEFVARLAAPWAFFVAFLFASALAWKNRARQQNRSWWVLFPLLPLVADFLVQTMVWVSRLVIGGLLHFTGLETTALILGASLLVASVAGVVVVHRGLSQSRV